MKIHLLLSSILSSWLVYPWSKANYTSWTLCYFDGDAHFVKLTRYSEYFSHRFNHFEDLSPQEDEDTIINTLGRLPKGSSPRYTIINPEKFLAISTRDQEKYPIETYEGHKK